MGSVYRLSRVRSPRPRPTPSFAHGAPAHGEDSVAVGLAASGTFGTFGAKGPGPELEEQNRSVSPGPRGALRMSTCDRAKLFLLGFGSISSRCPANEPWGLEFSGVFGR